jgi:hypothetical protein
MILNPPKELSERKFTGFVRVQTADIMRNKWFTNVTLDHVAVNARLRPKVPHPTETYISRLYEHRVDYREASLRSKPFGMSSWSLHSTVNILRDLGIPYDHAFRVTEMKGVRADRESDAMLALLERIPVHFSDEIIGVVEDPRRFLLILNEPRAKLSRVDKRAAVKSFKEKTLALMDDEDEAMRMKLRYGGHLFDMESLKRGS